MKKLDGSLGGGGMAILMVLLTVLVAAISWIATCGIVKLITMCFGLDFNWLVATGIWLVITVIKGGWHININL